jgi:hypothetical protein
MGLGSRSYESMALPSRDVSNVFVAAIGWEGLTEFGSSDDFVVAPRSQAINASAVTMDVKTTVGFIVFLYFELRSKKEMIKRLQKANEGKTRGLHGEMEI